MHHQGITQQEDMATTAIQRPEHHLSYKTTQSAPISDISDEEKFPDMVQELYTPEEAYELTMKDLKSVYDEIDAI